MRCFSDLVTTNYVDPPLKGYYLIGRFLKASTCFASSAAESMTKAPSGSTSRPTGSINLWASSTAARYSPYRDDPLSPKELAVRSFVIPVRPHRHPEVGPAEAAHDGSGHCRYDGAYERPMGTSSGLAAVPETFGILDSRSPPAGVRHGPKGNGSR